MDNSEDRWLKLEQVVRKVIREELDALAKRILEGTGTQIALIGKKANVVFRGGKWIGITADQREAWSAAYPSVDLEAELMRAGAWITSNPHLAPKSQYARFINHWLSKSHMTLSIRSIPTRSEPGPAKKLCSYCDKVATGCPNKIWACDDHFTSAMHHEPVPMFKSGVTAKPVAGS